MLLAACRRVVRWQVHRMHDLLHESPLQLLQPPQQCRGHCGQLRSSPRCTRGNHSQLSCLINALWEIAEGDVIEQLSGKGLSSQFQFNHKMPLPKWRFFASKALIKVLESIRTRLAHDTTLHSGATPLLSMVRCSHSWDHLWHPRRSQCTGEDYTVDLSGTNARLSAVAGESIIVTCRVWPGWHPSHHGATAVH